MNTETNRKRIIVAEDIPSIAALMVAILDGRGYDVLLARDGEECMRHLATFQPDLMIVDIMMPKLHGVEVLRRVKDSEATARVGVVICTAKTYKPDHDQARALGAFEVLVKPFKKEQLVEVVERFFSGSAGPALSPVPQSLAAPYVVPRLSGPNIRMWGTRGSIPVSGARFMRHGGSTSCIEFNHENQSIIFDAGTGIRELGLTLAKQGPRRLDIFITHTHWDHIQGFPFFAPAYIPGFEIHVYGAQGFKKDLRSVFRGQLDSDYFPVQFEDMRASIEFHSLERPPLTIGKFELSWEFTHHPAATLAYKGTTEGKSFAYVSDNEFLFGYLGAPQVITIDSDQLALHKPLVDFVSGVDVLVAEAQYLNEEYRTKVGWGHSALTNACVLAKLGRVKRWIVTHHDPLHDDEFLDQKLNLTKQVLRSIDYPIEVRNSHDGLVEFV